MPLDEAVWVWIEDAVKEYEYSRAWLDEQVRHGKIRYQKDGRRTYLLREDVARVTGTGRVSHLRPRREGETG